MIARKKFLVVNINGSAVPKHWTESLLDALAEYRTLSAAAQARGIKLARVYQHMKRDPIFAAEVSRLRGDHPNRRDVSDLA